MPLTSSCKDNGDSVMEFSLALVARHFVRKECVRFNQLIFACAFACIRSSFPLQVEARKEGCHVGILSKTNKRAAENNSAATKNIIRVRWSQKSVVGSPFYKLMSWRYQKYALFRLTQ